MIYCSLRTCYVDQDTYCMNCNYYEKLEDTCTRPESKENNDTEE